MSKRGLSLEEKKTKMIEIFHETKDFYQLKELEKLGPKLKGIVGQSVKDVIADLLNDNLIQFDKIGTSNYYWCFPSAAGAIKQTKLQSLKYELASTEQKVDDMEVEIKAAQIGREESTDRQSLLSTLQSAHSTKQSLLLELAAYGAADPIKLEAKKRGIELAKEAVMRWTDNTMIIMEAALAGGTGEMTPEVLREFLGIEPEWEDLST